MSNVRIFLKYLLWDARQKFKKPRLRTMLDIYIGVILGLGVVYTSRATAILILGLVGYIIGNIYLSYIGGEHNRWWKEQLVKKSKEKEKHE